jgi:hypothetical protein
MSKSNRASKVSTRGGQRRRQTHKKPDKIKPNSEEIGGRGRQRVNISINRLNRLYGSINALKAIHNFQKSAMKSNMETHKELMEAIGDLSDNIPEGDYLKISNLLRESYIIYDSLAQATYGVQPRTSCGPLEEFILPVVWASHPRIEHKMKLMNSTEHPNIVMLR